MPDDRLLLHWCRTDNLHRGLVSIPLEILTVIRVFLGMAVLTFIAVSLGLLAVK